MRVGLECSIGRTRIAIPVEAVDQIIEYELTSPLPLAREFIGGLGVHEQRVIVSVQLLTSGADRGAAMPGARVRATKGVLLDIQGAPVAWALEVAQVGSFVRVELGGDFAPEDIEPSPAWISPAVALDDGRSIGWVDVGAMVASLGGGERA